MMSTPKVCVCVTRELIETTKRAHHETKTTL